jgi:signal transduction histidine kinase
MKQLPFRQRLTVWSTVVAAVSILICGVGAAWFVHHSEVAEIDSELRANSGHFFAELQRHGGTKFDWRRMETEISEWLPQRIPPSFMEIRSGPDIRWRSKNLAAPGFEEQTAGIRDLRLGSESLRLYVAEQGGVTFAIAYDLEPAKAAAIGLILALLSALPIALVFAWVGGRRLAALAVEPVEEMTAATERITAEHLDQRVPVPSVADEIQRHAHVLNATLDRLECSFQQALRFSGDASHELKTPLTVLRSSIEAVLDSPSLADTDRAAIGSLLEQTRRLTDITASLLLLARSDAGRLSLDLAEHNLADLIEACAEDARIVAEQRGVSVECECPPMASARVDPVRFAQIASNLLDNAVKYNCSGGKVRVTLADDGAAWRLTVANTGAGIAPQHRARLFERFFRAEHTAAENGHGLGLSLARELARAHGGDVTLLRSDGEWTEFAVTIPKAVPHREPQKVVAGSTNDPIRQSGTTHQQPA